LIAVYKGLEDVMENWKTLFPYLLSLNSSPFSCI